MFFLVLTLPAHADVTDGLVGWWKLDEGSGVSAVDSGGSNTGGLSGGPTWVAGKRGEAVSFDGVDDLIGWGSYTTESTTYTVAVWYKSDSNGATQIIFSRGDSDLCFYNPAFRTSADGLTLTVAESGCAGAGIIGNYSIAIGVWNHIVLTRSTNTAILYLNGQLQTTDNAQPVVGTGAGRIRAGAQFSTATGNGFFAKGTIDDVRIYNRALTQTEIKAIYMSGSPRIVVNGGGKLQRLKMN